MLMAGIGIGILVLMRLRLPGRYIILWATFTYFFVTNSYISDDAFITFRTVDNFVNGYGLTWNPVERVQGYTNPLWMLLTSALVFITRFPGDSLAISINKLYWVTMVMSYVFSFITIIWIEMAHKRADYLRLLIYVGILFSSKAFVDFTSSGLESPLSYLCIALFFIGFIAIVANRNVTRRGLLFLYLIASFGFVNRMDNVLLFLAPLLFLTYVFWRSNPRRPQDILLVLVVGCSPAYAWVLFSIVYYGFPLPNTFYAKAVLDMDKTIVWNQGLLYLQHVAWTDPVTVVVIAIATIGCFLLRPAGLATISLSILIYLAYVVNVGGDFMGGRFLAAPFLLAVICLSSIGFGITPYELAISWPGKAKTLASSDYEGGLSKVRVSKRVGIVSIVLLLIIYNVAVRESPIKALADSTLNFESGGANGDKSYYYVASNILSFPVTRQFPFASFHLLVNGFEDCLQLRSAGNSVIIGGGGVNGYCNGPNKTLIDNLMLTEPLLARVPLMDNPTHLSVGHVSKTVPAGLVESYEQKQNLLKDPGLREYYEMILDATQGDLFTADRWESIYKLNIGGQGTYRKDYD
jgi:arabinofuranosyltransferase